MRSAIVFGALGAALMGAASAPFCCHAANAFASDPGNSGPGSGDDDDDYDFDSSGPGGGDDDDFDSSGHGGGDDDDFDFDSSGPGSGDDDFDSSGPGSGDDDFEPASSGHGGDDDFEPDSSGPGGGDDFEGDDDNSGPGGGHEFEDDDDGGRGHDALDDHVDMAVLDENIIYSVEYDSHGDEYVPGEIVFVGGREDLARVRELGFGALSTQTLSSGGLMARLTMPRGVSVDDGLALLASAAPDALVTPNSIYRGAQAFSPSVSRSSVRRPLRMRGALGVIDTGVDVDALPVSDALLTHTAFAGPRPIARQHGSTVASIAIARGMRVHVADVFGHSADGSLAASAERIAAALDWMIAHRVPVVNISVEGPDNAILAEMVRRATQRGHIIVAAAGNGGPSASPSFPAAFENVLAVTAIDASGRPYFRANRGSYIDFAAPGVDVTVDVDGSTVRVSGTSFAAPAIAAEAAAHLHEPSPSASARVLTRLRAQAEDLGAPGHDNVFGWGALRD